MYCGGIDQCSVWPLMWRNTYDKNNSCSIAMGYRVVLIVGVPLGVVNAELSGSGRAPAFCDWGGKNCMDMDTCSMHVHPTCRQKK